MSKYLQQQLIAKQEAKVDQLISKAIAEWQLIPHSRFALKPFANAWSANECLQHLNSYGRYYLPAIQRALEKTTSITSQNFTSGWLGNYFTNLMMPKANGLLASKMKSPKDHAPTNIIDSNRVIAEFIDQQEILLKLLRDSKQIDLNKVKVSISIAPFIKLKLGDVFMFLIAHLIRHSQQADRAIKQAEISVISPTGSLMETKQ